MGVPWTDLDILRIHKMLANAGIQTPDGPSLNPVITSTTLCRFHSNPGRSIPQPSHYIHYAMSVPFKPRTVHPSAQSLHPLRFACSIQTPDGPFLSPVNTSTMLCRFHSNPGRSNPQPSHYNHYAMPVPFKPRTVHPPAQSLHQYACLLHSTLTAGLLRS